MQAFSREGLQQLPAEGELSRQGQEKLAWATRFARTVRLLRRIFSPAKLAKK
jgi:hypothetical protein